MIEIRKFVVVKFERELIQERIRARLHMAKEKSENLEVHQLPMAEKYKKIGKLINKVGSKRS